MAARRRWQRGREATSSLVRLLAAFVAVLLAASSLGQSAHFLLVPHAICAEHGELLELTERDSHAADEADHATAGPDETRASAPGALVDHEHCQVLLRGQREQSLPEASAVAVLPAASAEKAVVLAAPGRIAPEPSVLSLAPKTSPPSAARC
jgi:hypothetical protein